MLDHSVKEVTMKVRFFNEEIFFLFLLFAFCRRLHISIWWAQNVNGGQPLPLPAVFPATGRRQTALRKLHSILLTSTQNLLPSLITLPTYTIHSSFSFSQFLPTTKAAIEMLGCNPSVKTLWDSCSCEISQRIVFQYFYISHFCDPGVSLVI